MSERRLDPRTDPTYSLRNLLRVRAARHDLALVVVSTTDGLVMASSRDGAPEAGGRRAVERAAAHASDAARTQPRVEARWTDSAPWQRLRARRVDAAGRAVLVSVVGAPPPAGDVADPVDDLAARVASILSERALQVA